MNPPTSTDPTHTGPTHAGTCPLSHHIEFRGQPADAEHALRHYLTLLEAAGTRTGLTETDNGDPNSYRAQARITVPEIGDLVLSLSAVANPAYVEAFTYRANLTLLTPAQVTDQAQVRALFQELELLPLTDYELVEVRRQFPLTQQLATSCGPTAMSELAFLMAIHHMTDFVGMLDALVAMGADRRHVTILDKGYPYTDRHRVDGWLRTTLGMNVDFYPDRERIVGEHIARSEAAGLKTMIFDDGGHCWPVVTERYPDKMGEFIGIVEQTISGIWKIEGHPLPDADPGRLALAFALHLDIRRRRDPDPVRPCVISRCPPHLPSNTLVRLPHLIAHRLQSGSIEDLTVWEVMTAEKALCWLGGPLPEKDKRLLIEQKLTGLLALRSQARAGRLPDTEAGRRLANWLINRYLSIRMVYQHIDLFLALLDSEAPG